jgi:hypothetical protein
MNKSNNAYARQLEEARARTGLSVDEVARRSGYPADLVRPLFAGEPPDADLSEQMNAELCEALGLDAREMWRHAREWKESIS